MNQAIEFRLIEALGLETRSSLDERGEPLGLFIRLPLNHGLGGFRRSKIHGHAKDFRHALDNAEADGTVVPSKYAFSGSGRDFAPPGEQGNGHSQSLAASV